mmetsp:Transcript_27742/g.69853  ORF Transcript_27742/g.69853 Transcript_27742/m.69853 type:complete len:200 (+) Transcript_27742:167-766(+)
MRSGTCSSSAWATSPPTLNASAAATRSSTTFVSEPAAWYCRHASTPLRGWMSAAVRCRVWKEESSCSSIGTAARSRHMTSIRLYCPSVHVLQSSFSPPASGSRFASGSSCVGGARPCESRRAGSASGASWGSGSGSGSNCNSGSGAGQSWGPSSRPATVGITVGNHFVTCCSVGLAFEYWTLICLRSSWPSDADRRNVT